MYVLKKSSLIIGFIDSGIGGLNLLNSTMNAFENVSAIYYADNQNVPYGNKSKSQLVLSLKAMIEKVVKAGANIVVIACGTLSTNCLEELKNIASVPIFLTLPPKLQPNLYKKPTLIATPMTITSPYVEKEFKSVFKLPLPFLASEIEKYIFSQSNINIDKDLLGVPPLADAVILGCTHYYYFKDYISKRLNIPCFDATEKVLNDLSLYIKYNNYAPAKNFEKRVFFIGENAEYNYKVFKNVLNSKCESIVIP